MTTSARSHIRRIIAPKSASAIVTRSAIVSRSGMLLRLDRRHLTTLRCIRQDGVAIRTIQALRAAVIVMAEYRPKDVSPGRRPAVRCELVAYIARSDLAFGCVA